MCVCVILFDNYNCFDPPIKTYGVTLTYSNNPRKHICTYAGGYNDKEQDHTIVPVIMVPNIGIMIYHLLVMIIIVS